MFLLGTRGSPLALTQAGMVRDALMSAHGWDDVEIVVIRTTGDRVQDRALAEIGGKALWTKELDRALLAGEVDACVHSMKDVETLRPDAIAIAAMLPRADVRDRLIGAETIAALPQGATVGTSSPRRAAQVRRLRPDVVTTLFRGNVDTRLGKLAAGEVDATLLAAAGFPSRVSTLPRNSARALVAAIDDAATYRAVATERAFLAALRADCHSPVAALAQGEAGGGLLLRAQLLSPDGACSVEGSARGDDPVELGARLAGEMLAGAPPVIRDLFG